MNGGFALEELFWGYLFDIFNSLIQYYKQYTVKSERYPSQHFPLCGV